MAEDKQEGTGGISSMHWRYAATILVVTLVLYLWNVYFMPSTPQTYPLNYTQFMEQLNANNIKSVSIKKLQVRVSSSRMPHTLPGREETPQRKVL